MKAVELSREVQLDIERMQPEVIDLIRTLCAIPAPSHHEERRAAFIRDWFEGRGMHATIDEAKNVLCPMGVGETGEMSRSYCPSRPSKVRTTRARTCRARK